MSFDVLINGVGDAFSRRHWGTNFLCRSGDFVLAVDCPDSYRRALNTNKFAHAGQELDAAGLPVRVVGEKHAVIHPEANNADEMSTEDADSTEHRRQQRQRYHQLR